MLAQGLDFIVTCAGTEEEQPQEEGEEEAEGAGMPGPLLDFGDLAALLRDRVCRLPVDNLAQPAFACFKACLHGVREAGRHCAGAWGPCVASLGFPRRGPNGGHMVVDGNRGRGQLTAGAVLVRGRLVAPPGPEIEEPMGLTSLPRPHAPRAPALRPRRAWRST